MAEDLHAHQPDEALAAFGQEFGKVLDPVAFLNEKNPAHRVILESLLEEKG